MATQLGSGPPASARPTGTVTFAFTDIEGSTQRWERDRSAMQDAVRRHDALIRSAIAAHDGYVFKTLGDAFCAAFWRPEDAVAAIVDAQHALGAEDFSATDGLPVRAAVHTGTADERDGDYFGPAVNRVARLLGVGHGGQILLSGVTRDLAHSDLPAGASLVDLGSHRLRDLREPEHVWQLSVAGLPVAFPALTSLDTIPNNLPIQQTSFRGREQDLAVVRPLLGQHKLLTLFGSGGVGKTRLALQVGADVLDQHTDGVWFADFAPISDPELVASVIAKEIGMPQVGDRRVDEAIPQWLRRKKLLLILDNCEHVLETAAAIADTITRSCPDVRLLATSRQALGVSGEVVHRLPSLAIPEKLEGLSSAEAIEYGAVALFVDRATAADTRFILTDDNAAIVAEICRRLDGIPLAIELAAARVKVLSIPNLAQRLNERFKILTGGSRTALPRQKTLGALIDWSYDLLTPQEQMLFSRVGIFAGGFTLDAATAVCGGEDLDEIDVLDLLSSLTDKSLVVADTTGEQERYHLLESTRAYALEKLAAAAAHEQLARRHAEYFRSQVQEVGERTGLDSSAPARLAIVEQELDNYRATLEWALKDGHDIALGSIVAGALNGLWSERGLSVEGRYWIGLAQAGLDESIHPQVAARLWIVLWGLSSGKRALDCAQRAVALSQSARDEKGNALALSRLAVSLCQVGRLEEAREVNAQAIAAIRTLGDKPTVANSLNGLAAVQAYCGDIPAARELFTQALAAYKVLGDEAGAALVLSNLAEVEFGEGQVEQAVRLADEALEIHSRRKSAVSLALSYPNITAYRIALGDMDAARESAREGLRWAQQAQIPQLIATALQHLALLFALRGEVKDAARLIGYVNAQYEELGYKRGATERWSYEKLMSALHDQLSKAEIEQLAAEGATLSEDRAAEEALKV
jgi:predicted ATPase/class 3 adenylate cyclase